MKPKRMPSPALAEMYRRDEALGVDPLAFERPTIIGDPPPREVPTLRIPEPDWDEETRQRLARERETQEAALDAEIARRQEAALLEEEPSPHPPAARKTSSATPRRDAIAQWLRENRR